MAMNKFTSLLTAIPENAEEGKKMAAPVAVKPVPAGLSAPVASVPNRPTSKSPQPAALQAPAVADRGQNRSPQPAAVPDRGPNKSPNPPKK